MDKQIYYRLIALWAVCEGVLGGIIHGFNLPIAGFIVGGAAVIIITLIAWYVPIKGAILRATLIVCIFKMMLSPQSPLPAYFAVFFQGITGELFFFVLPLVLRTTVKKIFRVSCLLFATLALAESSIQKILILTLYYGTDFWKAVNSFISGLTNRENVTNYSKYIAGGYVLLHVIEGILLGLLAGKIPLRMQTWKKDIADANGVSDKTVYYAGNNQKRKKIWKNTLFVIWIILLLLYVQSEFAIGKPVISSDDISHILIRSTLILFTWYFLISPVLTSLLKKWLAKQQSKNKTTINEILLLIPYTRSVVEKSWQNSSNKKGFKRLNIFMKTVLVNSLHSEYNNP